MSEIILKINRPTLRVVLNGTVPITGGGGGGSSTLVISNDTSFLFLLDVKKENILN